MERLLCILSGMNTGGAETFLMKIYRSIDRSLYQFDFCINSYEKTDYEDEIVSLGGKIYRIPSKSNNLKQFRKQLYELVKENHYKNVLRITSNAAGFLDLKIAKKAGASHTIARSSNSSDGNRLKARIAHFIGKKLWMHYVDTMIAPSDLAAKYTFGDKNYQNGKVIIIKNGLDLNYYNFNASNRDKIRQQLHIDKSTFVIGHIGRFTKQKNHSFLIDVFEKYHLLNSNSALILVGDGPLKPSMVNRTKQLGLEKSVFFLGIRKDIPDLLSSFDVFLLPSLYEGMPNAVIEAQASGLKCVVSDAITREANASGNVIFKSIDSCDDWINTLNEMNLFLSRDLTVNDKMQDYDIRFACEKFIKTIFKYDE